MGVKSIPQQKFMIALCLSLLIHGVVAFYADKNVFSLDAGLLNQDPQFTSLHVRLTTPKNTSPVAPPVKYIPKKPIKPASHTTKPHVTKTTVKKTQIKTQIKTKVKNSSLQHLAKSTKPINQEVVPAISMDDKNSNISAMQSAPASKPIPAANREIFKTTPGVQTQLKLPEYLNNPKPLYPLAAKRRGMQGQVLLQVTVTTKGTASKIIVKQSSGFKLLDKAAVTAVASWKFVPAMKNANPIESIVVIPVRFELAHG
jgi:TonB family protein